MILQIIITALLYLVAMASGVWLRKMERPLNKILFTVHKLGALTLVVVLVYFFWRKIKAGSYVESDFFYWVILSAALMLIVLITGSFLSFDRWATRFLKNGHRFAAFLVLISSAAAWFFYVTSTN